MEKRGGSKRRGESARNELEHINDPLSENAPAALKKVLNRNTPTWVHNPTANQVKEGEDSSGGGRAKEAVEIIVNKCQRDFTDRLKDQNETKDPRVPRSGRWNSRSQTPRDFPVSGPWLARPSYDQPISVPMSLMTGEEVSLVELDQNNIAPVVNQPQYAGGYNGEDKEQKFAGSGSGQEFHGANVSGNDSANANGSGNYATRSDGVNGASQKEEGEGEGEGEVATTPPTNTKEGTMAQDLAQDLLLGQERETEKVGGASNRGKGSAGSKHAGGLVKGPWTKEEDQKIIDCITHNITKWSEIAERVDGRVGKQCRERWFNHLDPSLKKSSWTPKEDEILVEGQGRFGNSWTKIAKLLPGRSENAVKNRWNSAARKHGKKNSRNSSSTKTAKVHEMNNSMPTSGVDPSKFITPGPEISMIREQYAPLLFPNSTPSCQPQTLANPGWLMYSEMPEYIPHHELTRTLGFEAHDHDEYREFHQKQPFEPPMPQMGSSCNRSTLSSTRVATGVLGMSNNIDGHTPPSVAAKRDPNPALLQTIQSSRTPDDFGDSKGDTFGVWDEVSLSHTLFNLSLSKSSLNGLNQSFGKAESDETDESLGQLFLEPSGCRSAPRGVTGTEFSSGMGGLSLGDRGLDGYLRHVGISEHELHTTPHPRPDLTSSVAELLFAPAQSRGRWSSRH